MTVLIRVQQTSPIGRLSVQGSLGSTCPRLRTVLETRDNAKVLLDGLGREFKKSTQKLKQQSLKPCRSSGLVISGLAISLPPTPPQT